MPLSDFRFPPSGKSGRQGGKLSFVRHESLFNDVVYIINDVDYINADVVYVNNDVEQTFHQEEDNYSSPRVPLPIKPGRMTKIGVASTFS